MRRSQEARSSRYGFKGSGHHPATRHLRGGANPTVRAGVHLRSLKVPGRYSFSGPKQWRNCRLTTSWSCTPTPNSHPDPPREHPTRTPSPCGRRRGSSAPSTRPRGWWPAAPADGHRSFVPLQPHHPQENINVITARLSSRPLSRRCGGDRRAGRRRRLAGHGRRPLDATRPERLG